MRINLSNLPVEFILHDCKSHIVPSQYSSHDICARDKFVFPYPSLTSYTAYCNNLFLISSNSKSGLFANIFATIPATNGAVYIYLK